MNHYFRSEYQFYPSCVCQCFTLGDFVEAKQNKNFTFKKQIEINMPSLPMMTKKKDYKKKKIPACLQH